MQWKHPACSMWPSDYSRLCSLRRATDYSGNYASILVSSLNHRLCFLQHDWLSPNYSWKSNQLNEAQGIDRRSPDPFSLVRGRGLGTRLKRVCPGRSRQRGSTQGHAIAPPTGCGIRPVPWKYQIIADSSRIAMRPDNKSFVP